MVQSVDLMMAQAEGTIRNPVTGEKVVFQQTGADTDGRLLKFDMFVEPGGFVAAEHIHPSQTEHFTVQEGELRLRKQGDEQTYQAGEEATIPPGTPHVWWNSGDGELHVTVEIRPADRFSIFLTSLFALARDGKTDEQGMPGLLQLAVMMDEYDDVIYPSSPPRPIQKLLFGILAPIGRWFGHNATYPYPS